MTWTRSGESRLHLFLVWLKFYVELISIIKEKESLDLNVVGKVVAFQEEDLRIQLKVP